MKGIRTLGWMITTGWFALSAPSMTSGEPFLPQQDTQVLEHLTVKAADPVAISELSVRTPFMAIC